MKGDFFVVVVLITSLANLPEIQSQDCRFYYENDILIEVDSIDEVIKETQRAPYTISTFRTDVGVLECTSTKSDVGNLLQYINYTHEASNDKYLLKFILTKEFGDDYDNALIPTIDFYLCSLNCTGNEESPTHLVISFFIEQENTKTPVFNRESAAFELDEACPVGLDISSLLDDKEKGPVSVLDMDFDKTGQSNNVTFKTDNPLIKILETRIINFIDSNGAVRNKYEPRFAVAEQLNVLQTPVTFDLIASDQGVPPRSSTLKVTINLTPHDLQDPKFEEYYYTSSILDSQYTGELNIKPQKIRAFDGDSVINARLTYRIEEYGGLDLELEDDGGGVKVNLITPISIMGQKMTYVVIEAIQEDGKRKGTVVLAIELPLSAIETTTVGSTSTSPLTTTCLPCSETTTNPTTCPETTKQSCSDCTPLTSTTIFDTSTTISETSTTPETTNCPLCQCNTTTSDVTCSTTTFDPITDCPASTGSPLPCLTTCDPTSTLLPTTSISSSVTNPILTTTNNSTTSVTTTTAGTGTSSSSDNPVSTSTTESTSSTCLNCPTCSPTSPNTPNPSSSSTPTTEAVSTSCPLTCPEPTTASNSVITTTVTVTCPTSTTPSGNPTVQFEKQQYWSEVVENTPVDTPVVMLVATSTSGEQPEYRLKESPEAKYFVVDIKTGMVKTSQRLPLGNYNLEAIAKISSGDEDTARIVVDAVKGTLCNGTQFSKPLYQFTAVENSKGYAVGKVEFYTDDETYSLEITSSDPYDMKDYFDVFDNGSVTVIKAFNRTVSGPRVTLTISIVNKKSLRITQISTIAVIEVLYINQEPQFSGYSSSVMVGYPDRTYFDPSVQMPIFTAKAEDNDSGGNGTLSYYVKDGSVKFFEIDLLSGVLFAKGMDKLESPGLSVQIAVKDQQKAEDSLNITVAPLREDCITMMEATSESDSLTDEMIASDMSRILSYQVTVLRLEKSTAEIAKISNGYSYIITVYAVDQNKFVSRDKFTGDVNKANFSTVDWSIVLESLSPPLRYEAEQIINKESKDAQSFTIATAVLASLIGLALMSAGAFIIYKKKFEKERPWSKASRAASLEVDKKHWDNRSLSKSQDYDGEADGQVYNSDMFGERNGAFEGADTVKPVIRFSTEKFVIDNFQAAQTSTEDEAYCPPTPVPKKSILKDPGTSSEKNKQKTDGDRKVEDAGVKFSPTPEVIQVAATSLEPSADEEVDLDNKAKNDDDDDFLIEEF